MRLADRDRPDAQALVDFADDRGVDLPLRTARQMCRDLGYELACTCVAGAQWLMDAAARDLGVDLTQRGARIRLAAARYDLSMAFARLRRQVAHGRHPRDVDAGRRLQAFADVEGVRITLDTATRHASDHGAEAYAHVRDVARVLDCASRLGLALDEPGASARIRHAEGDAEAVVGRLELQARRRDRRGSRFCLLSGSLGSTTRRAPVNNIARCACERCIERLVERLRPYTTAIVRSEGPSILGRDDAHQEADVALVEASDCWPEEGDFTAFYGTVLANKLTSIARWHSTQGRGGQQPLSLDETIFPTRTGRPTDLLDTLPHFSVDPLFVVMLKEGIQESRAAGHDAIQQRCIVYELERLAWAA